MKAIEAGSNSAPIDVADTTPIDVANAEPIDVADTKPIDVANAEPIDVANAKSIDVANAAPINGAKPGPIDVADAKPIDGAKPEPVDGADAAPIAVADAGAKATLESELSARPKHDLPELEAFRGLAAVMVLFTHVGFISGVGVAGAWAGWLSRLDFGVALFFLLSGFLLFRPFVQAAYGRRPPVSVRSYLRRRYVRIYPALLVVLLFDYLITPNAREASLTLWVSTLFLVQNYTSNFVEQLPGLVQGWSLCIEVSFYLTLPLLARLILGGGTAAADSSTRARSAREARRARTPAQIRQEALELRRQPLHYRLLNSRDWRALLPALRPAFFLGGLVLVALGWRLGYLLAGGVGKQMLWLPAYLDWFAAGMAMAWLRERDTPVPRLVRDVASSAGACWSLALAGYWLTTTKMAGPFGLETPGTGAVMLKHVIFLLVAILILLPPVFGDPAASWRRVACKPFFIWLGQVSFGVFLWHPMLMEAIRRMLRLGPMTGGFWVTLALTLLASAAAATLSWRFIEEPLQRRWRNGFRRSKHPTRSTVPRRSIVIRRKAANPS